MGPFNLTIFLGLDFFPVNAVKVMTTQLVFIYKVVIIDFVFVGVWRGVLKKGRVTCDIIIITGCSRCQDLSRVTAGARL